MPIAFLPGFGERFACYLHDTGLIKRKLGHKRAAEARFLIREAHLHPPRKGNSMLSHAAIAMRLGASLLAEKKKPAHG
jgi:hypothetical protein